MSINLKKVLTGVLVGAALPTIALAHGNIWYDKSSHLPQYKKMVIFPITNVDGSYWLDETDIKSDAYEANQYLNTRFIRKLKIKNTISLGTPLDENKKIRIKDTDVYTKLLPKFPTEKERAAMVDNITAADGYLSPRLVQDRKEPHLSPATTVTVRMQSYTEETNGPNGNRTYNKKTWNERYTIPARQRCLYHMQVEHDIFDRDGKKVMTYKNGDHTYQYENNESRYRLRMFKDLVNEFREDYEDIKKEFLEDERKKRENDDDDRAMVKIAFKNIQVPDNVGNNEYYVKSVHFVMKNFALKHTKARVIFNNNSHETPRYYVQGAIYRFSYDREWIAPHVTVYNSLVSSKKQKWRDRKGKEHTMRISDYKTSVTPHLGRWQYTATVSANFSLVDARTGRIVVNHNDVETDDKRADAYRHFMKKFYEKVQNYLEKTGAFD